MIVFKINKKLLKYLYSIENNPGPMTSKNTIADTQSYTIERSNSSSSFCPTTKYDMTIRGCYEDNKRDPSNPSKMYKRKENQLQVIGVGNPIAKYNIGAHANFACPTKIFPQLSNKSERSTARMQKSWGNRPIAPRW